MKAHSLYALGFFTALVLSACERAQKGAPSEGRKIVRVDGSSTVYPVTEAVAEEFKKAGAAAKAGLAYPVEVTVGISGTGGGFKKFCRGEIDVQDASRPILAKEMEDCRAVGVAYVELPVAFDALTVVVSASNAALSEITIGELKQIWAPEAQGKVLKWKQVRDAWPDAPLKLYGAGADSGTFDYFTEAVTGKAKSSRSDFTASEDDNVLVQGIANDRNALGFLPYAYYEHNQSKLKALKVNGVAPSPESVENGRYAPLSRPIFLYVSVAAAAKPEVKAFIDFYLANVAKLARQIGYVALPERAYSLAASHFASLRSGTVFGGVPEVGLKIEELLKREARLEAKK
mgnify:CR=1 FL=1